ncbi:MAG: hypothetical protein Q9211_000998 [Gyalolechia sp. 1 TL-2023]
MSPRRSSRSKTSQPTSATQKTNSSSSSVSSGRADGRSRSDNKPSPPQGGVVSRSPGSEDRETPNKSQVRRTRGSQEIPKVEAGIAPEDEGPDEEGVDEEDEEEITRCVCGQQEYPGMPTSTSKSNRRPDDANASAILQEDTGGMFIQCDICKVWQHGGCVGIMDEVTSPEEYFCEQCRRDLHTITSTSTGRKHSIYHPVQENSPPQSPKSPGPQGNLTEKPKEGRSSRLRPEGGAEKRRSTMNSRDAAYYEAEQLRRAIEESKKDGTNAEGSSSHPAKRSRDGSDQRKDDQKRQRTESGSSASLDDRQVTRDAIEDETENVVAGVSPVGNSIRGAPARNHRTKDLRELEEKRENGRSDAAGRRKGKSERRFGDESDLSEEPISRTASSKDADHVSAETPSAPAPAPEPAPAPLPQKGSHHKKTGRPPARRGRVGRNQYSKDRDRPDTPKNPQDATSPTNSHSSKEGQASPRINGHSHETGRSFKARHINPVRTSMLEMKRRVAGILKFISCTQVEMAAEASPALAPNTSSFPNALTAKAPVTPPDEGNSDKDGDAMQAAERQQKIIGAVAADIDFEQFKNLGSLEMMEVLTRKLMKWQGEYGRHGEK